jgi:hypothetical protein
MFRDHVLFCFGRDLRHATGVPASWLVLVLVLAAVAMLGCEDKAKLATQQANELVDRLTPLIERDTQQIRKGLPEGAKKLGGMLDDDPGADLAALQRSIARARAAVEDLAFAKSTFFVFVGKEGTVLRSETDPDLPAGKSLYQAVPGTKKLSEKGTGLFETYGFMHGLRGVQQGPDKQWIVGHPVESSEGEVVGSFVTGWSLRKYAHYLEEDTRRHLTKSLGEKSKAIPLVYVFVVVGDEAFGAPVTPDVNAEALVKLDVMSKAKGGALQTSIDVDGRDFIVVAKPFSQLGDNAGLAIMLSPV